MKILTIRAIDESGVLRPTEPLNLLEHTQVELAVRTTTPDANLHRDQIRAVLLAAGVTFVMAEPSTELTPTPERQRELAQLFTGTTSIADMLLEDRAERW